MNIPVRRNVQRASYSVERYCDYSMDADRTREKELLRYFATMFTVECRSISDQFHCIYVPLGYALDWRLNLPYVTGALSLCL